MKKVIVTKLSRAIRHVVSRGAQGPRGGLWAGWADIPDKPDFDALYDPHGAASAAQSAAAADATAKVNTHEGAADPHPQYALNTGLSGHAGNTANPHEVTKYQVGLGNVDNTSDASKPVSTAQQNALNGKEPTITAGTPAQFWRGDKTWQTLDKTAVGLSSVENKSSATIRGEITSANVTTAIGYTPMRGDEVSALPAAATYPRQARILTANNRPYWSDGTTWIDLSATGGRSAEYAGLEAETYALIAARTTHPSNARATVINALVASLKSAGVWSKLGMLYLLAAGDEQAARLNWKNPGTATITAVNSPAFTVDRGFTGDGVSSYLNTGVAVNAIPGFATDNAMHAVWTLLELSPSSSVTGATGAGSTNKCSLSTKNASSKVSGYFGSAAAINSVASVGSAKGLFAFSRTAAGSVAVHVGASKLEDVAVAYEGFGSSQMCLLRSSSSYSSQQIAFAAFGGGLSSAEMAALHSAVQAYLQALGAVA